MATLTDRLHAPQTIYWHRRLSELEPAVTAHYAKWARAAIEHGEYGLAEVALERLASRGDSTAAYHHLRSSLHLALRQRDLAEKECAEALRLRPDNPLYQLNLASVRLGSTNSAAQAEARATLLRLAEGNSHRMHALRALLADELAQNRPARATALSQRLILDPDAAFNDRLQHLHLLTRLQAPEAPAYIGEFQRQVRTTPSEILQLANWLNANGRASEALKWLNQLAGDVRDAPQVQMAMVNCLVQQADWNGVEALLKNSDWDEMDFLRLAMLARAHRQRGNVHKTEIQWNAAVTAASSRAESLFLLVRTVSSWDWPRETHDLLWVIARGRFNPKHALHTLYRYYQAGGDTQGLYRALVRMLEIDPADQIALNNFAVVCFLLNVNLAKAHQIAADLHARDKSSPVFVSTYAFSLHLQGRSSEGRRLMDALGTQTLEKPSIAAYYGLLLAAEGASDRAKHYFRLAERAHLLPQERNLMEQAIKAGAQL